jgi:aryl-alcohol dehydrogenase-like predicted oxidoreductase
MRRLGPDGPTVSVVGLGGMLLSISGRPPVDQAVRVIQTALDNGVTLIDTADAYCLDETDFHHNERLIARTLIGRTEKVTVMTKVGVRRPGGAWTVEGDPKYLTQAVENSLRAFEAEALDVVSLHSPDIRVPFEDSVGALARLKEQGKIKHVGLCNVSVEHIERARAVTPIQCIQNRWNPLAREVEKNGVLEYCRKNELAFIAYAPFGGTLGAPTLTTLGKLGEQARRRRMSPYRLVLAWMLNKSPVSFVIPGARRPESIEDTVLAGTVELDADAVRAVENSLPPA